MVPQTWGTCKEPALSSPCSPCPYGEKERGLWLPPGSEMQVCLLEHVCLLSPCLTLSREKNRPVPAAALLRHHRCDLTAGRAWRPIPGGSGSTGSGCSLPLGINAWECFQALLGCRCSPEGSQIRDLQAEEQLPPAGRKLLTGLSKAKNCFIQPEINTDFEPCEIYIYEFILSSNKGGTLVFKFQQGKNFAQCL